MYNKLNKTLLLAFLPMLVACLMLINAHAGTTPSSLAYNPATKLLYVTNSSGNNVYVVNTPTNTVIGSIAVGSNPSSIAINPQNTLAYVANNGGGTISVISLASGTVVDTITGANSPNLLAFNPSGTTAYVTEGGNDVISVINVASNTITNSISLPYSCSGEILNGVAFTPDGKNAIVVSGCSSGSGSANAEVINVVTSTVVNTIGMSSNSNPQGIAISPGGGFAYVSQGYGSGVDALNLGTGTYTYFSTAGWPGAIAFNPQGTLAYQLTALPATLYVISPVGNTVVNSITVGTQGGGGPVPGGIAFSPTGSTVWITNYGAGTVSVINAATNTIINTITLSLAGVSFSLLSNSITSGQTITFSTNVIGGIGPFDVELFNTTVGSNAITNVVINSPGVANTILIQSGAAGTFSYNELITDTGSGYVFNSLTINLVVSSQPSSGGGGGGGGPQVYRFALNDNINSDSASESPIFTGVGAGNVTYYQNQLPVTLQSKSPGINMTFACSVVISGKSYAYQNDVYGIGLGVPCGKPYYDTISSITVTYALVSNETTTTVATSTSTTTATTVQTTTVQPATTTVLQVKTINITLNQPQNATQLCNGTSDVYNVKYLYIGTTFTVNPKTSSCIKIAAINATSTSSVPNSNLTKIIVVNLTVSASNASVNAVVGYPCSISSSKIAPFILENGSWSAITPFSVDAAACTVSFTVPDDPVIGLFAATAPSSKSVVVVSSTAKHAPDIWYAVIIAVVIILLLAAAYLLFAKRGKQKKR